MALPMPHFVTDPSIAVASTEEVPFAVVGNKVLWRIDYICLDSAGELSVRIFVDGKEIGKKLILPDDCIIRIDFKDGIDIKENGSFFASNVNAVATTYPFQALVYTSHGLKKKK